MRDAVRVIGRHKNLVQQLTWKEQPMARKKTHKERTLIINRITELVKEERRIMTKDVITMFDLYRSTAEKYLHTAVEQGGLVRHGRCGTFRDQRNKRV